MATVTVMHDEKPFDIAIAEGKTGSKALDYAYMVTQNGYPNVDESWSLTAQELGVKGDVVLICPNEYDAGVYIGHRSTSIGDRMIIDDQVFEVASYGFERVE